jgi:aminopeptidase N
MFRLPFRLPPSLVLLAALLAGCGSPAAVQEQAPPAAPAGAPITDLPALPQDVHSYARPEEARVTHVALDLDADFDAKVLSGTATLTFAAIPGANDIVLDTRDLTIEGVTDADGDPLAFVLGPADPVLGQPVSVVLPEEGGRIVVRYRTSPDAAAVQWLTPAQTSSGRPFLFTQGQAILTRTWVPTQDSPGIRQTYEAAVTVPAGLTAVMSAEQLTPEGEPAGGGTTYRFRLGNPVPPYLIALAIGDLAFREIGPRSGVWAEPDVVERAAYEFADLEAMMDAAEALYGPYRWGRYDVLVLPPSFPFGGMENPRLTFATPTILAGDRSLVSLIAHELAHSWSGNLVTNATWADFWLNEGFTTYFENRIMEAVYGAEYARMLEQLSRRELEEEIAGLDPADTRLHLDLAGRDPDAGMTAVAYDKGAAFLRTVETAVGRERFDAFLRSYFDAHAFQPMTTEGFLTYLDRELIAGDAELRARIMPEEWAYGTGLPANVPPVESEAFRWAAGYAENASADPAVLPTVPWASWSTQERLHFLRSLPAELSDDQLAAFDEAFGLSASGNSEVLFAWLEVAIRNEYEPALPAVERFLTSQGRRKFVRPLYAALAATDWGRPHAERIYRQARPTYHSVTANSVDAILGAPGGG